MKIKDKIKKLIEGYEKEMDEFLGLTSLGTMINLIEEGINEIENDEIKHSFKHLQDLILDEREKIMDIEIKE